MDKEIYDFGKRLRELRTKSKLTQKQVAERLGLNVSTVSGYEHNSKRPSADMMVKLALLYGTSADYILGLDDREVIVLDRVTPEVAERLKQLHEAIQKCTKEDLISD